MLYEVDMPVRIFSMLAVTVAVVAEELSGFDPEEVSELDELLEADDVIFKYIEAT